MKDIDIVITYLDSNKENWQNDFKKYQEEEINKLLEEVE